MWVTTIGVRGGGSGGATALPGLKNFRENSVFRATTSCSKILNDKKYFSTVKNSRAPSVFQGKRKLLKNPECKKHIQYCEKFQGNSVFREAQVTQNSWILKNIFNAVKNFRAPSVFQSKRNLLKNSEWKKYIPYSEKFLRNFAFQGKR